MADDIAIEMFGDTWFRYKLEEIGRRALDATPVMRSIGEDFLNMIENRFAHEGGVVDRWAPLSFAWASKRGSANPILVHTGEMLIGLTNPEDLNVSHDGVTYRVPMGIEQKAESAQYGFHTRDSGAHASTVKFVKPRRFINITGPDRYAMENKISHYLVTGEVGHLYDFAD